jgi:hypothetical protein
MLLTKKIKDKLLSGVIDLSDDGPLFSFLYYWCSFCAYREDRCTVHRLGAKACTDKSIAFK